MKRIGPIAILVLWGIVLGLLSFGNHLCFRTYGLDLGIYTKTLYDFAHLRVNDGTFFLWEPSNQLGGHFDLYLMLLSPLVYVFGEYTLLIVQLLAVLLGMWGMYRLAICQSDSFHLSPPNYQLSLLAMLMLGLQFGVWHALAFDYHSNVVSAMLLPWLLYYVKRRRVWGVVLLAAAMAIAKETSALWVTFVLAALLFDWWRDRPMRHLLGFTALGCMVYFLVVSLLVMPALGGGGGTGFWRYEWMGGSVGEVARWVFSHPLQAVRDIFIDFTPDADSGRLKVEFFVCALLSGGLIALLKPNYLIMLVPPLTMKMLSKDIGFWGVTYQYNVEIAAVLAVAAATVLVRSYPRVRLVRWVAIASVLLTFGTLLYTTGNPKTGIRKENVRVLDTRHWQQSDFDVKEARRLIKEIPPDASVCATTMFTPHLATRDSVYIFPMGLAYGAEYYLLLRHHWCYYEGEEDQVASMIADTASYRVLSTDGQLYLLHRI